MNDAHVSRQDWLDLFSTRRRDAAWMRLQSRVTAHVNGCDECRALYEKGMALQAAARAFAASTRSRAGAESAFRAVASAEGPGIDPTRARGRLCVCLDSGESEGAFIEDTLELEGCANRYALNPEDDARRLADDDGALSLELRNGILTIRLAAGEPSCRCQLLADDEDARQVGARPGEPVEIPLPPDSFCTLEMVFSEDK